MVLVKPCLKLEKEILAAAADDDEENGLVAGYWPVGAAVVAVVVLGFWGGRGRRPLLLLLPRLHVHEGESLTRWMEQRLMCSAGQGPQDEEYTPTYARRTYHIREQE